MNYYVEMDKQTNWSRRHSVPDSEWLENIDIFVLFDISASIEMMKNTCLVRQRTFTFEEDL